MTGDDRFTPEQAEVDRIAREQQPPRFTEPCRRYVEQPPVTPEEIERFAERLKGAK